MISWNDDDDDNSDDDDDDEIVAFVEKKTSLCKMTLS